MRGDAAADAEAIELAALVPAAQASAGEPEGDDAHKRRIARPANAGYLATYFVVGILYGGLPATTYGVLQGWLGVPAFVYQASRALITLPWSFKLFIGALSDLVPYRGYRRKPYIALGWAVATVSLFMLAATGLPAPYHCQASNGSYIMKCDKDVAARGGAFELACPGGERNGEPATPCNPDAQKHAGAVSAGLMLACAGYMLADVAADGLTVTFAQNEPLHVRGYTQTTAYLARTIGMALSKALVGFGMNGRPYLGSFDASLSFGGICVLFALIAAPMVPLTWFCIDEKPVERSAQLAPRAYFVSMWSLMKTKAFAAAASFGLLYSTLRSIDTPAGYMVKELWAGVQNLQNQLSLLVGQIFFAIGLWVVRRYLLNFSWRRLLIATMLILISVDSVFVFTTVFNVIRNQYWFLSDILLELPQGIEFLVTTFYVVEAADAHNGGLVYGLLTTSHNIGLSLAPAIGNQIFGLFPLNLSDEKNYVRDKPEFRRAVAGSYFLSYFFSVLAFAVLPLLPDQKSEAHERRRAWGTSRPLALCVTAGLSVCFV